MNRRRDTFNRWFVVAAAAGCFAAAAAIAFSSPDEQFWWGGFLRAGVVLVALWFCLPSGKRPAAWEGMRPLTTMLVLTALLLVVIRPRIGLPILFGLLAVRWVSNLLRPPVRSPRRRDAVTGAKGRHQENRR